MAKTPEDDQDTSEFLSPAIIGGITELRKRLEEATTELTVLLDALEPQNTDIKRRVHLCLRLAVNNFELGLDQMEDAESVKTPPVPEKRLEPLGDALTIVDEPPGSDPYNQTDATPSTAADGPKTLSPADMRRLSETIKGSRAWTLPKRSVTNPRLAALCSDLERVLTELALVAELPGQKRLSDAARHIENAMDCLILPEASQS